MFILSNVIKYSLEDRSGSANRSLFLRLDAIIQGQEAHSIVLWLGDPLTCDINRT